MEYLVALRVGQNDIKALLNLENSRKQRVMPLLMMRGKDDKHINNFLKDWGNTDFYLDISRFDTDKKDEIIVNGQLNDHNLAFQKKHEFYKICSAKNKSAIPVIGWFDSDPPRSVVQLALNLENEFENIAIRIDAGENLTNQLNVAKNILNSVKNPKSIDIVLDFCSIPKLAPAPGNVDALVNDLKKNYDVRKIVLLSTSFPSDKPPSGNNRVKTCKDILWQIPHIKKFEDGSLVYGDYGATDPASAIEYIAGMPTIPFANYLASSEWWQSRKGTDKEYIKYIDIAKEIVALPQYHGDEFCWATREISRISKLPTVQGEKYGNNGAWNGHKINQHICAILYNFDSMKINAEVEEDDI